MGEPSRAAVALIVAFLVGFPAVETQQSISNARSLLLFFFIACVQCMAGRKCFFLPNPIFWVAHE